MRPLIVKIFVAVAMAASWALAQTAVQPTIPAPHHEANFEVERQQADALFTARKTLEALPLYEDLCRQDQTIAVFAERHGAGLEDKAATIDDPKERLRLHNEAMKEIQRAQALGDNDSYVRTVLNAQTKNPLGAIFTGIPLTVGYTYHGKPEAQADFRAGETAFAKRDMNTALAMYLRAAAADPMWYDAALFAGDAYFQMKDTPNAGIWYARAIAIDPDRETGYRYWGDALFQSGDREGARAKFVQAVVAEPYGAAGIAELESWAKVTGHQVVTLAITRPPFTSHASSGGENAGTIATGELNVDPALAASTADGRSAWIVYQQYRVAHGARTLNQFILAGGTDKNGVVTPSGYHDTIAEEHAALRAMLAEVELNLKQGVVIEANLDPSIRNLRVLEKAGMLGAWIALSTPDPGIRQDYPEYRAKHRQHLVDYVNGWLIR